MGRMLRILSTGSDRADSRWRAMPKRWLNASSACARMSLAESPDA